MQFPYELDREAINSTIFERLCSLPEAVISNEDVAWILNVSLDELKSFCLANFSKDLPTIRKGNISFFKFKILAKQIERGLEGNVQALIWLGKQYLGQSDKIEHNAIAEIQQLPRQLIIESRPMTEGTTGGDNFGQDG